MILHITTKVAWLSASKLGEYIASSLLSDGFIHCSTPKQTVETANLFFKGQNELVLLCIDEKKLISGFKYEGPCEAEVNKSNHRVDNLFPHVYGPINISAVVKVFDFPCNENGLFELPAEIIELDI